MVCRYGLVLARQPFGFDQPRIAVDRRQAVAEFMSDSRRQLSQRRETLLEPKPSLELGDSAEVGEETDHAERRCALHLQRRNADPQVRRPATVGGRRDGERTADDRLTARQPLFDDLQQGQHACQEFAQRRGPAIGRQVEHALGSRVDTQGRPVRADHNEAGHHALDDVAAQTLGRLGAGLRFLLLRPEVRQRLLDRGRHEGRRRFGPAGGSASRPRAQRPSPMTTRPRRPTVRTVIVRKSRPRLDIGEILPDGDPMAGGRRSKNRQSLYRNGTAWCARAVASGASLVH